jgi:hypothetical protein
MSIVILREYDVVRVVRLLTADRPYDGTEGVVRPPSIGDIATICHEYEPSDPSSSVVVEMVDQNGMTLWLADFSKEELELVERP